MRLRTRGILPLDPASVVALLGAGVTTAVLIGSALRPGYALYLDHIAVPDPARPQWESLATPSGLRAWPLSGLTWAWSQVLPSWTLQHVILVLAVGGAGLGVGLILRRWGWVAALAGAVLGSANPYVVERLLLGQSGLLLAYASLPWIVIASRQATLGARLALVTLACVPAALTPWGGIVAGVCAVGVLLVRGRGRREIAFQAGASIALCLPWFVPALLTASGTADPDGARAFRLAGETGLPTAVAALVGRGVWSPAAQLAAQPGAVVLSATVTVVLLGGLGAWSLLTERRRIGLVVVATWLMVPVVATALSGPLLEVWSQAQTTPALALFRDLHRLLAPSMVALSVLAALGLRRLIDLTGRGLPGPTAALGAVLPVALAITTVPDAPARLRTAYQPAPFSSEWSSALAATGPTGLVLSLPWQPLRVADWMPNTFLDPTAAALGSRVVADTTLTVVREGETIRVREDAGPVRGVPHDPLRDRLTERPGDPVPSTLLTSSHISAILVWRSSVGAVPPRPQGWVVRHAGPDFEVWAAPDETDR